MLIFLLFESLCVQEQVDETYIMVKPDGVQRGLVSSTLVRPDLLTIQCHLWLSEDHRGKISDFRLFVTLEEKRNLFLVPFLS